MDSILKKMGREVLMALLFFLPEARRIRIERWLRGRDETSRLARADVAVVSFGKKVVLLVRNPKDIAVSQYFQWQHRMRPVKKKLNNYPPHGADVSAFEFVMDPACGLPQIIDYLNLWAREAGKVKSLLIVRYEDMREQPVETLARVMEFIGGSPSRRDAVASAVEYASVENMRKLEERNTFWLAGGRMKPGKKGDPNSYKVRRAKVGGYKDYFDDAQAAEIDELVRKQLSPAFGYETAPAPQTSRADPR